jgi:hypothetical protein
VSASRRDLEWFYDPNRGVYDVEDRESVALVEAAVRARGLEEVARRAAHRDVVDAKRRYP